MENQKKIFKKRMLEKKTLEACGRELPNRKLKV